MCGRWDVSEKLLLLDQYAEQQEQRDIKQYVAITCLFILPSTTSLLNYLLIRRSLQPLKVSPLKLGLTIEGDIKRQERDLLLQVMQEVRHIPSHLSSALTFFFWECGLVGRREPAVAGGAHRQATIARPFLAEL